jgi:hypothetical protein
MRAKMTTLKHKLAGLYNDQTKHSRYQNIPHFVCQALNYSESIDENWRGDSARYQYLLKQFSSSAKSVFGDIGANTGFFTLSLAHVMMGSRFYAYEMNKKHTRFMELVKDHFSMENIRVISQRVDLSGIEQLPVHHILINFNVLHHAGVDFDKKFVMDESNFTDYALIYLSKLKSKTSMMYFQMGYNWGGNKKKPIVPVDNQEFMVRYEVDIFKQCGWEIVKVALFNNKDKQYHNLSPSALKAVRNKERGGLGKIIESFRISEVSEFYKRPLMLVRNPDFKENSIKP